MMYLQNHKSNKIGKKWIGAGMLLLASTSASAASYYNCALNTECKEVSVNSWSTTDYTKTKYPLVLQHGILASNDNNFYGIAEDLTKNGSQVIQTKTNAFHSSYRRGEVLLEQVDTILALLDTEKLNLIGHSHGGFDVRYVAAARPEVVASVMAVGSPARGSDVADFLQNIGNGISKIDKGFLFNNIASVVNSISSLTYSKGDDKLEQNSLAALQSLSTKGAAKFNQDFPMAMEKVCDTQVDTAIAENGVAYYSWSGTSQYTNPFDPSDIGFTILNLAFNGKQNDGLVSRCSSHVGYVIKDDYNMNHLDEINKNFGLVNWIGANPKSVYRAQVNRLKTAGY